MNEIMKQQLEKYMMANGYYDLRAIARDENSDKNDPLGLNATFSVFFGDTDDDGFKVEESELMTAAREYNTAKIEAEDAALTSDDVLEYIATYEPGLEAENKLRKDLKRIQGEQRVELLKQLHQRFDFGVMVAKSSDQDFNKQFPNMVVYRNRVLDALSIMENFYVDGQFPE